MRKMLFGMALAAVLPALSDDSFSPALFWWWNSKLDVRELCAQVDDFYDHGSRTLCIHPFPRGFRPGRFPCDMSPDYLTDGYLDVYAAVTDHAAAKGMTCWFYDEGGWPSGGVCGQVMAADPVRFACRWMTLDKAGQPKLVVEKYDPSTASPYPSVIEPGVTEMFLSLTHEQVKKRIGRHFGKAVPWLFTDEPSTPHGFNRLGWTSDFEREFRARKGYDIQPFVANLIRTFSKGPVPDEIKKVRIDYYDVLCQLFLERFVRPCRDWCRKNGLLYGGHFDGDDDMRCSLTHGHNHLLRCLREMDLPGVDCIWRQIHPDVDYSPLPRYASSAAHQTGAKRVLSESFAIFGETLSPEIMKRTVDFEMVRGVNQFVFAFACQSTKRNFMSIGDPHLGKPDPKWPFMKAFNDYVRDTCARLAEGTNPVRVAVYYDVRSVWAGGLDKRGEGEAAYQAQIAVAKGLDARQVDFDFVDDELIEAGRLPYAAIVFPTDRYLNARGKAALDAFRARGGLTLGPDELDRVPRTCRAAGTGREHLRATKRLRQDGSADYFLVNESGCALELKVSFDEGAEHTCAFEPYGSQFVRVGKNGKVEAKPLPKTVIARRILGRGWTVRKVWSVKPGAEDFEYADTPQEKAVPCEPGDWGTLFGTNFSGRAVYRTEFFSAPGEAYLDLGKVGVCAQVKLNGKGLEPKFAGPFRWPVTLARGTNVLEVTVGNTLANALIPELERIGREFPPPSSYTFREKAFYAQDDLSSGLIGPVCLDITSVSVSERPLPSFRPGAVSDGLRATLTRQIPASLESARLWSAELLTRGAAELPDGSFQKRRFFKRLELVSNLVANTSFRFRRGTESDFGHAERALDDLVLFRRFLEKELTLWKSYPENPAVKATVLNVRDFGATGDGKTVENAAFERALAAVRALNGEPAVLNVPAGDYLFESAEGFNLMLTGLTNFVLRGESPEKVRFLCGTYDAGGVRIDRCENVTAAGFQNRYVKPTFFQGDVLKADNEKGFIEVTLDKGCLPPTDPSWTNHYAIIRGSLYHRDGRMDLDCPNAAFEFDADDLGGGKYRIHFSTRFTKRRYGTLKADRKFAIPNRDNRYGAMTFKESTYCNFEDVWVRQARAAAFAGSLPRNCSLIGCRDFPLEGMVMSSCADSCIYSTGMYLEGCDFRGMGDDGVNTLTHGGFVCARTGADSFVHDRSPALVVPGQLIQFMDPATGEMLGNARIERSAPFRWQGRACQQVTLDRPVPDGVASYDDLGRGPLSHRELDQATVGQGKVAATPTHFYIPNAWGVGSVISGCSFATTRCAGLVLQNSNTLVENCKVDNAKTGFRINALGQFREGTPPQNVIVRNCTFSDIGEDGVIVFQALQNTPPVVSSMGFLRIENCAFSGVRREVLALSDAADCTIRGITDDGLPVVPRFIRNDADNDLGENPYGIVAHSHDRAEEKGVRQREFQMMADAGIGWIRVDLHWRHVQPQPGATFDFSASDKLLDEIKAAGLEPLFILHDPPLWARPMNRHLGDWRTYVEAVMAHYGKRIKAVEIWNEPNARNFWDPYFDVPFGAVAYYEFHKIASEAIRAANPAVRISTAGFTGVPLDVLEEIYKLGGKDTFDIVSVHPYARPEPPEGDLDTRLVALRRLMRRYGDNVKPIWITEIGWPTPEVRMACPTVIGEGLRQAWPEKRSFRIVLCGVEPETEDPTGSLLAEVRGVLPAGSTVMRVAPEDLSGVLSRQEADAVMYPLCNGRFPSETFAAVTNFVAQGGTLIAPGDLPLQSPMKVGGDGRRIPDRSLNNGTLRQAIRLGWDWLRGANGKSFRLRYAPAPGTSGVRMKTPAKWNDFSSGFITLTEKFLKPGDRMIPLLTAETNGVRMVGAAVYRFGSDWKGALIVSSVESERGAFTEAEQASRLRRAAGIAFSCKVEKFFVYEFMAPEKDPVYRECHYGIVHPDLTPKPAFEAYRDYIRRHPYGR